MIIGESSNTSYGDVVVVPAILRSRRAKAGSFQTRLNARVMIDPKRKKPDAGTRRCEIKIARNTKLGSSTLALLTWAKEC